jgi:putative ABC transport system ATP-binding protein
MLEANQLGFAYGEAVVLRDVSITVSPGQTVALVGPSGAGKSTLLYCLAGMLRPHSGDVRFEGTNLRELADDRLTALRREHFGFLFQSADLLPELTLAQNVSLPMELNGWRRPARRQRVTELLARLGVDQQADRFPSEVSGGQAQRAALARALAHRPKVVFADEPTGALDSANGARVLELLLSTAGDEGASVVIVTHDTSVAEQADLRWQVQDGVVSSQVRV